MITEQDLEQAIAECQGDRHPNANTCIKLAAFYTIRQELFGKSAVPRDVSNSPGYSFADAPKNNIIVYESETEFGKALHGRDAATIWPVIDELMDVVQVMMPKLYEATMRKIK